MPLQIDQLDDTATPTPAVVDSALWYGHETAVECQAAFFLRVLRHGAAAAGISWANFHPFRGDLVAAPNQPNAGELWLGVQQQLHDLRAALLADNTQPLPESFLSTTRERLNQLTKLGPNWDSYGASPVSEVAILRSNRLLEEFLLSFADLVGASVRPYAVAPLSNGGVQLEWRGPTGFLEVEVGSEGDLGYLLAIGTGDGRTLQEGDDVTSAEILQLAARILF